jgi:hypothetical protein
MTEHANSAAKSSSPSKPSRAAAFSAASSETSSHLTTETGRLSPSSLLQLQGMVGNAHVQRMIQRSVIQRDPPHAGTTVIAEPPVQAGETLDAQEAVARIDNLLFDSNGFFATAQQVLGQFQQDMVTELGGFAGDRRAAADTPGTARSVATALITDQAKEQGKKALQILVQGLSGTLIAAGPATATAGVLMTAITTIISGMESYRPVVVVEAATPTHQVYIEGIQRTLRDKHDELRDSFSTQRTEMARNETVEHLRSYGDSIRQATERLRNRYYGELSAGYLPLSAPRSLELETPHARYSGTMRDHSWLFGAIGRDVFVEQIQGHDIYVELRASDYRPENMQITRSIVPELPSRVLGHLNDPQHTQGMRLSDLTHQGNRLVMEVTGPDGNPARIAYQFRTGLFDIPASPHFSEEFCRQITRARGDYTNVRRDGERYSSAVHSGAVNLYANIINRSLSQFHFSA